MTSAILHHSAVPGLAAIDSTLCEVCRATRAEPCGFCGGAHHARHCRSLYALLYSSGVLPPRILAQLLQQHRALAYDFLESLPVLLLTQQADVLAAWQASYLDGATADALLNVWMNEPERRVPRYELLAA